MHPNLPHFVKLFFSNPSSQFIDAAKEGSKDHLCGTLDALSWGNEAPIGTGGPFELIYSGKVNEPKLGDDIYRALHSLKQDMPCQNHIGISKPDHDVCDKWKRQPPISNAVVSTRWSNHQSTPTRDHIEAFDSKMPVKTSEQQSKRQKLFNHVRSRCENHASSGFESTSISCKTGSFSDVVDMHSSLRRLLHRYTMNQYLSEADKASVMEGLSYHPKRDEKLGCGIREIKVGHSPSHPGSRCFILIRNDGTMVDFSYRKCVLGAAQRISPRCGLMVEKKLFHRQSSM